MEIRAWHIHAFISCFLIIPYTNAKSVSLNDLIAAETKQAEITNPLTYAKLTEDSGDLLSQKEDSEPPSLHVTQNKSDESNDRGLLNKILHSSVKKFKTYKTGAGLFGGKLSGLGIKKYFPVKPTPKPKSPKQQSRLKHKKLHHEANELAADQQYLPLFKSISILFDNILTADGGGSNEELRTQLRRFKDAEQRCDMVCKCGVKPDTLPSGSKPQKKAVDLSSTTTEIPRSTAQATPTTTNHPPLSYLSSIRQNKNLPVLLTRNSVGTRRDYNGLREGSRAALHRSTERDISGNHGDSQRAPRSGQDEPYSGIDEKNASRDTRDHASSYGPRGRGNSTRSSSYRNPFKGSSTSEDSASYRRPRDDYQRQNQFQTGRDQTQGPVFLPEFVRRIRGPVPKDQVGAHEKSLRPQNSDEESYNYVPYDFTDDKRFSSRGSTFTREDKKVRSTDETVTIKDFSNIYYVTQSPPRKPPVVMIIDGYSMARDKNGRNKISENTSRMHTSRI